MSSNERKFRIAARAYAERKESVDYRFFSKETEKGKEIIVKVPLREDWTKMFFFDGKDGVSIKNRLSDNWGDKITVDAFCIAYGG